VGLSAGRREKGARGHSMQEQNVHKNEAENIMKTKGVQRQIRKNEAENVLRNKVFS
jgi:hypothetical protein